MRPSKKATPVERDPFYLTGNEVFFDKDTFIVSKTDVKGKITYANRVFLDVAQFSEAELLGKPHNIIRHPDMPKCVFKFLWDRCKAGQETFAYVINRTKHGDAYWVFAHITPSYDASGNIIGYHSNRRVPKRDAVEKIKDIYALLCAEERKHATPKAGMEASLNILVNLLQEQGISYDEFILSL